MSTEICGAVGIGGIEGVLMKKIGGRIAAQLIKEWTAELTERMGKEAAEKATREAIENILEAPAAQFINTFVSKMLGTPIGSGINTGENALTQHIAGVDTADAYQVGIDGQAPAPSASDPGTPLAGDHPGAPPIHHAE